MQIHDELRQSGVHLKTHVFLSYKTSIDLQVLLKTVAGKDEPFVKKIPIIKEKNKRRFENLQPANIYELMKKCWKNKPTNTSYSFGGVSAHLFGPLMFPPTPLPAILWPSPLLFGGRQHVSKAIEIFRCPTGGLHDIAKKKKPQHHHVDVKAVKTSSGFIAQSRQSPSSYLGPRWIPLVLLLTSYECQYPQSRYPLQQIVASRRTIGSPYACRCTAKSIVTTPLKGDCR